MTPDDDLRALVERLRKINAETSSLRNANTILDAADALERMLAERDRFVEAANAMALAYKVTAEALARSGDECAALREKAHRVMDADLCLDAVTEARRVLREHFGANHAFLNDDLIRGVVKMREQIVALERERKAQLEVKAGLHALISSVSERVDALEPDARIGKVVWSFIDRMNDVCDEDPADKIVREFVDAVMPEINAAPRTARGERK